MLSPTANDDLYITMTTTTSNVHAFATSMSLSFLPRSFPTPLPDSKGALALALAPDRGGTTKPVVVTTPDLLSVSVTTARIVLPAETELGLMIMEPPCLAITVTMVGCAELGLGSSVSIVRVVCCAIASV